MGFSGDRVQRLPEQLGSPSRSHQNRQFRDGDRRDGAGRAGKNGCEARAARRDRAAPRRPGPSRAIAPILAGPGIFLVRRAHRPLCVRRAEWAVLRVPGPHQTMHRRHHRRPELNRPGARGRRLLRRDVHFALENDGWNCPFESKVHISAGRRSGDRPHRANPGPRRTVAAVGPASRGFGQGRLFGGRWCGGGGNGAGGGFMAALSCLDHLSSVGPPYSMNQEGYSGIVRVVLVGLVGLAGAWACPNLPQRRPGPGSAANETAEYQRFSSGAPARSGPLWQIWTTGAAAGRPGRAFPASAVHDVNTGADTRAEGGRRPGGCPVRPCRPRPSASAGPAQAPRSARSPLNPRERTSSRRSRALPDDLGG